MDRDQIIKYCAELLALLTMKQLEELKAQIDENIKLYEDDN